VPGTNAPRRGKLTGGSARELAHQGLSELASNSPKSRAYLELQNRVSDSPRTVAQARRLVSLATPAVGGSTAAPIQRRKIDPSVYEAFDPNAAQDPTKKLLQAGFQEDQVDAWSVQANTLVTRLQGMTGDEMVGTQAGLAVGPAQTQLQAIQTAGAGIRMFLDRMIIQYTSALDPNVYTATVRKGTPIKERLGAQQAAMSAQAKLINDKNDKLVPFVTVRHADARTALQQLQDTVTDLENQKKAKDAAKASYGKHEMAFTAAKATGGTFERAQTVGVSVSAEIDRQYQTALQHATNKDWIAAGVSAEAGRKHLDSLHAEVQKTEQAKQVYDSIQPDFRKVETFNDDFARLHIEDDPRLVQMRDARKNARDAAAQQDWVTAAREAKTFALLVAPLQQLIDEFGYYREATNPPRLLVGTLILIFQKLSGGGAYTNRNALDTMERTFAEQCKVTRLNWLQHLHIAGANVKIGSNDDHYTTFNDSVPMFQSVSVYDDSTKSMRATADICDDLFNQVGTFQQIHATRVVNGNRYHRYWDGTYSPNVAADNFQNHVAYADLNAQYAQMLLDMQNGVAEASRNFGRISHNNLAQQVVIQ
jgi:hypothetical protein